MAQATSETIRKATLWFIAILSIGIALGSARYLIPGAPGGAPPVLDNPGAKIGLLTIHAGLGLAALIIGPFQFFTGLRRARPALHRRMGQIYVACCLAAGACGLALAFGSTAGPVATAGFGLLAIGWLFTTSTAWRCAVRRDFVRHEQWMIRSFAMTFAAVTLRLYLIPVGVLGLDFTSSYRVISFLAWVPNVLIAEMIIYRRRKRAIA